MGAYYSRNKLKSKSYGLRISNRLKIVNYLTNIGLMSEMSKTKYILGTVIFLVLSFSFIKSSMHVLKSRERLDDVNREVALLEQQKIEMERDIEYRKSDEYIEQKARDELNLIKPNEKVYVVSGGESVEKDVLSESSIREEDEKKDSNWYSWYRLFFDN